MKSISNTMNICKKAYTRMCFFKMITQSESNMLERCLKTGVHLILQDKYLSFGNALNIAKMQSLKNRRIIQMTKFAKHALKSEKHSTWFEQIGPQTAMLTRNRHVPILKQVQCRTQRYAHQRSIPIMTKILSWHPPMSYTPVSTV